MVSEEIFPLGVYLLAVIVSCASAALTSGNVCSMPYGPQPESSKGDHHLLLGQRSVSEWGFSSIFCKNSTPTAMQTQREQSKAKKETTDR